MLLEGLALAAWICSAPCSRNPEKARESRREPERAGEKNHIRRSHVDRECRASSSQAAMDYSLAAVKMNVSHLKPAKPAKELTSNGGTAFAIGSLVFQRVWLQGVLVQGSDEASLALQDGTGVLPLQMVQESLKTGIYVLVVGAYLLGADGSPFLLVHKIVDLSSNPDRDTFWRLEVAEIHKLFYDKLMNASST